MKYTPNQTYDISSSYWCEKGNRLVKTSTKGLAQMCLGSSKANIVLGKTISTCNICLPEECDIMIKARDDAKRDLLS